MFKTFCKKSSKDHTMLALAAEGVPSLEAKHNKDGWFNSVSSPQMRRLIL